MLAAATRKIDRRKDLAAFYKARATPEIVNVPVLDFVAVDGEGDPETSADFAAAIEALYGISYTLKFTLRARPGGADYAVMPLEALWWSDDMSAFRRDDRKRWKWTAMIAQPPELTAEDMREAASQLLTRKPDLTAVGRLRWLPFTEGLSAQLLHVGPYNAEQANIERLHDFIAGQGGELSGKHHEIYLSDARRTAPDRLRTIVRQPFIMKGK